MKFSLKITLVSAAVVFLSSCGSEKESDKIGDAQICLNSATNLSTANACLAKIEGIESTAAYAVRCNGSFIAEGFANPTKYINATSQLNGTSSSTANFMTLMTFTAASTFAENLANAGTTFSNCLKSGAKGTTLFSSFGYLTMSIYNYAKNKSGTCSSNPTTDFSSCLSSTDPNALYKMVDPTTSDTDAIDLQNSIGGVIVSSYNISCAGKGANESLCNTMSTTITNAGGSSNTRAVGSSFFKTLACNDSSIKTALNLIQAGTCP